LSRWTRLAPTRRPSSPILRSVRAHQEFGASRLVVELRFCPMARVLYDLHSKISYVISHLLGGEKKALFQSVVASALGAEMSNVLSSLLSDEGGNLRAKVISIYVLLIGANAPPGFGLYPRFAVIRFCSAQRCSPTRSACATRSTPIISPPSTT
jgi:hypothetical protein